MGTIPNPIPATFVRGGTSKGIFLNQKHLPQDKSKWASIFLGIMGSPDPDYGRQLNGMGGGVSSLSKICVVGEPSNDRRAAGIDAEYTFCQVGIKDSSLDFSGNCGNLSSMIGVYAVDERICSPRIVPGPTVMGRVHSFNTNTNKRIDTTFPVSPEADNVAMLDLDQTSIAGVPGMASKIDLDFVAPAGARTGKLLPSGNPLDTTTITNDSSTLPIRMSLVDATNPTVFILSHDLAEALGIEDGSPISYGDAKVDDILELLRRRGAELMGLDPSAQAQPKIAILSPPSTNDGDADIVVHALSMGVLHKAIPMTVGLCLGVAAGIRGTLVWEVVQTPPSASRVGLATSNGLVKIRHPSGIVEVGAEFASDGTVTSAKVIRTGRRLMRGEVWW